MILGFMDFGATCELLARSKVLRQWDRPDGGTVYLTETPLSDFPPITPLFPGAPTLAAAQAGIRADLVISQSIIDGSSMVSMPRPHPDSVHERVRALIADGLL